MIKRNTLGQFIKGTEPVAGFNSRDISGANHPKWKGGNPKCPECGKEITRGKKRCAAHSFTPERIEAIRKGREGIEGEKHPNWKGDAVSYSGLHRWIRRKLGTPKRCDHCGNNDLRHRQYHWANKSKRYERTLSDWMRLCVKCHQSFDKKS